MRRERFTGGGLIALSAVILLVTVAAAAVWTFARTRVVTPADDAAVASTPRASPAYLVQSTFPSLTTSTRGTIEELLINAFRVGRLYEAGSWGVPDRYGARIIFAAPTLNGSAEPLVCGFKGHTYCGLYLATPTSTSLLAWGDDLTGFMGVERFLAPDRILFGTAWSFWDYTNIEHKELDLKTGAINSLFKMDLDVGDGYADLEISASGESQTLHVSGSVTGTRMRPDRITIRDTQGRERFAMSDEDLLRLHNAILASSANAAPPILVLPSERDIEWNTVHVQLFGFPYAWDVRTPSLARQGM